MFDKNVYFKLPNGRVFKIRGYNPVVGCIIEGKDSVSTINELDCLQVTFDENKPLDGIIDFEAIDYLIKSGVKKLSNITSRFSTELHCTSEMNFITLVNILNLIHKGTTPIKSEVRMGYIFIELRPGSLEEEASALLNKLLIGDNEPDYLKYFQKLNNKGFIIHPMEKTDFGWFRTNRGIITY